MAINNNIIKETPSAKAMTRKRPNVVLSISDGLVCILDKSTHMAGAMRVLGQIFLFVAFVWGVFGGYWAIGVDPQWMYRLCRASLRPYIS